MGRIFDMEGGIMGTLGKLTDIIILSLLFLTFSIPIVTIGAAFTAMYYTSVKCIRRGRGYLFQSFWKSFRENLKPSLVIWMGLIAATLVLCINLWFSIQVIDGTFGFVMRCIYGMMGITLAVYGVYVFPVLSRFHLGIRALAKTSCLMALKHLPFSILMLVISVTCILAVFIIPPLIFVLPASGTLLFSLPMEYLLKKYTPASEDGLRDEWYLE